MKWTAFLQIEIRENYFEIFEHARMTTLSEIKTERVDIVLRHIVTDHVACSAAGKIGTILPLHILFVFGDIPRIFEQLL